jgi:hypothetical protein
MLVFCFSYFLSYPKSCGAKNSLKTYASRIIFSAIGLRAEALEQKAMRNMPTSSEEYLNAK